MRNVSGAIAGHEAKSGGRRAEMLSEALAALAAAGATALVEAMTTDAWTSASASGQRSISIGGDNSGIASSGDNATNVQMRAEASGSGRVYQAGRDQTINER